MEKARRVTLDSTETVAHAVVDSKKIGGKKMSHSILDWWTVSPEQLASFSKWHDHDYVREAQRCRPGADVCRYGVVDTGAQVSWVTPKNAVSTTETRDVASARAAIVPPGENAIAREKLTLELRRSLGEPDGKPAPWIYVVQADIPDHIADEYNAWYDQEHLPRLVAVPGIRRARRFVTVEGAPKYFTAYDLDREDSFATPEAVKARKTPWTEKMRDAFLNSRRSMLRLAFPK
jgi:hypothetical protein